jgi:hypothetical protein
MAKLRAELEDYRGRISSNDNENTTLKTKIQKLVGENSSLNEQVNSAQ